MKGSVCLAILNYNGRRHLEHLLPTACAEARSFSGDCSIVVLDNCSTQNDVAWVRTQFPEIEVVTAPKNDFLFSYNWLAEKRTEDILVILNNDLKLRPDFLAPLVRHFAVADVFAVNATSRDWNDKIFTCGPAHLKSHHGLYHWDYDRTRQEPCHTLFCSGGFMAVSREKFLALGGFNRLYWPAYAEDLDLCFQAWRTGWRCIFEPASVVLHRENGTWSTEVGTRLAELCLRRSLLFQWSSLPTAASWAERTGYLLLTAYRKSFHGQTWWIRAWLAAWFEWRRKRNKCRTMKASSEELSKILARIAEPLAMPSE